MYVLVTLVQSDPNLGLQLVLHTSTKGSDFLCLQLALTCSYFFITVQLSKVRGPKRPLTY
jgi:hypothetical protein